MQNEQGAVQRDATILKGIELVLRRVFAESGMPLEGPWEMQADVEADVENGIVSMHFELRLRADLALAPSPRLPVM